ncbi:riboflavin kinase [Lecanora helva]
MRPDTPRILAPTGPSSPQSPFPLRLSGPIIKGFGRGSAELGIPTANIPIAGLSVGGNEGLESGVYYGWAGVDVDDAGRRVEGGEGKVWAMVMSVGWNPFYKNKVRSVEVHILHKFDQDFYGARMNLLICGFIRPEYDYVSKESLVEDINVDIEVAKKSLEREAYLKLKEVKYLLEFEGAGHENDVAT